MRTIVPILLHGFLITAVLAGTMPCACTATPMPRVQSPATVVMVEEDACPCCPRGPRPQPHQDSTPQKSGRPVSCPPNCFFCAGAITPMVELAPLVVALEPALDHIVATLIQAWPVTTPDPSVPPPRSSL